MPRARGHARVCNHLLKQARIARGWSQRDVADRLGDPADASLVAHWELGASLPGLHYRTMLCELFGMSASELGLCRRRPQSIPFGLPGPLRDPFIPAPFAQPRNLVGRAAVLAQVERMLASGEEGACAVLYGLPGIGKTTLAAELAARPALRAFFSDGILWAGLGQQPHVEGIVSRWGKLLHIGDETLGKLATLEERSALLKQALGMRRVLLVIDDVWDIQAAALLKLGGPRCAYLMTTRLPEVALSLGGGQAMRVTELSEEEGVALLTRLAPLISPSNAMQVAEHPADCSWRRRSKKEPESGEVAALTRELVRAVGGLPLALSLIGHYLLDQSRHGGQHHIRQVLERLRTSGQWVVSLQAVIALSYEHLDDPAQQVLQAAALLPPKPNTFAKEALLHMAAASEQALDRLVNAGLVEMSSPGRYTLHQTIADFALLQRAHPLVQERMVAYFAALAEYHASDYAVLEEETGNILAAFEVACALEMAESLVKGVNAFAPFLLVRGQYLQAEKYLHQAKQLSTSSLSVTNDQAGVLRLLGSVEEKNGRYGQAEAYFLEGLSQARHCNDEKQACLLLTHLGDLEIKREDYVQAEHYFQAGLRLAEQIGYEKLQGVLLADLGEIASYRGQNRQADEYLQRGLALLRRFQQREELCAALSTLGMQAIRSGNYQQAEDYLLEGLDLARQIGYPEIIANLLRNFGALATLRGRYECADAAYQEGLELVSRIGNSELRISLLTNLGDICMSRGQYREAKYYLEEAQALVRALGQTLHPSLPITLAAVALRCGEYAQAEKSLQEAVTLARRIGESEAVIFGLATLSEVAIERGNWPQATTYLQEGLALASESDSPWLAELLVQQGVLAIQHEGYAQARECLEEGLALARRVGNPEMICVLLKELGKLALLQGDYQHAEECLDEGVALARTMPNPWLLSGMLLSCGELHLAQQRFAEAARLFSEAEALSTGASPQRYAAALYGLARVAAKQGDSERAYTLGRKSLRFLQEIGHAQAIQVEQWLCTLSSGNAEGFAVRHSAPNPGTNVLDASEPAQQSVAVVASGPRIRQG